MIKLTRSALTMLLAHYRAIFKHAYVKGLATAVVVGTLGVAGTAQAANDPATIWTADSETTLTSGDEGTVDAAIAEPEGDVKVSGGTLTITAAVGATTPGGTLTVTDGAVSVGAATSLETVTISGGTTTFAADVDLKATGVLTITGGTVTAASSAVSLSGSAVSITGGTISQTGAADKNIVITSTTTIDTGSGAEIVSTQGNVSMTATTVLTNGASITATKGNVDLQGTGTAYDDVVVINSGTIKDTEGDVTLTADTKGSINNSGNIVATKGDVTFTTTEGYITGGGNITASNGTVTLTATSADADGVAVNVGNLNLSTGLTINNAVAEAGLITGNITATDDLDVKGTGSDFASISTGSILAKAADSTLKNVTVSAGAAEGDVTIGGTVTGAVVDIKNAAGNITVNGVVNTSGASTVQATNGNVILTGGIVSTNGSTTVKTVTSGNISAGAITGIDAVSVSAESGDITISSISNTSGGAAINVEATNGGNITVGNIINQKADAPTTVEAINVKSLVNGGNINLTGNITGGAVSLESVTEGNISVAGDINAVDDAVTISSSGNVAIVGATSFGADDSKITAAGTLSLGAINGYKSDETAHSLSLVAGTGTTSIGTIAGVKGLSLDTTNDATFVVQSVGSGTGLEGTVSLAANEANATALTVTNTLVLTDDTKYKITLENGSTLDASAVTGTSFNVSDLESITLANSSKAIFDGNTLMTLATTGLTAGSGTYVKGGISGDANDNSNTVILNFSNPGVSTVYLANTGAQDVLLYDDVEDYLYATNVGEANTILKGVEVKADIDANGNPLNQALDDANYQDNAGEVSATHNAALQAQANEVTAANSTKNQVALTAGDHYAGTVVLGQAYTDENSTAAEIAEAEVTDQTLQVSGAGSVLHLVNADGGSFVATAGGSTANLGITGGATVDLVGNGSIGRVYDVDGTGESTLVVNGDTVGFDAGTVTIAALGTEAVAATDTTNAVAPTALGKIEVAEGTANVTGLSYVRDVTLGDEVADASLLSGAATLNVGYATAAGVIDGVGTIAAPVLNVGNAAVTAVVENGITTVAAVAASTNTVGSDVVLGSGEDAGETVNLGGTIIAGAESTIYKDGEHTYVDANGDEQTTYIHGAQVQSTNVGVVKDANVAIGTLNTEVLTTNQDSELTVNNFAVLGDTSTDQLARTSTIAGSYVAFEDLTLANGNTRLNIENVGTTDDENANPSFVFAHTWDLNGGTVALDPSTLVLNSNQNNNGEADVPTYSWNGADTVEVNGDLIIGSQSALYIGDLGNAITAQSTQAQIKAALDGTEFGNTYVDVDATLKDSTFKADYGALAYLDGDLVVGNGYSLTVNKSLTTSSAKGADNTVAISGGFLVLDGADLIFDQDQSATFSLTGTAADGEGSTLTNIEDTNSSVTAANVNLGSGTNVTVNSDAGATLTITAGVLNAKGNNHVGTFTAAADLNLADADATLVLDNNTGKTTAITGLVSTNGAALVPAANVGTLELDGDGTLGYNWVKNDGIQNVEDYDTIRKHTADFSLTGLDGTPSDGVVAGALQIDAATVVDISNLNLIAVGDGGYDEANLIDNGNGGWIRANTVHADAFAGVGNLITSSLIMEAEVAAANTNTAGVVIAGGDTYVSGSITKGTAEGDNTHINNIVDITGGTLNLATVDGSTGGADFNLKGGSLTLIDSEHDFSLGESYVSTWTDFGDVTVSTAGSTFTVGEDAVAKVVDLTASVADAVAVDEDAKLTVSGLAKATTAGAVTVTGGSLVATANNRFTVAGAVELVNDATLTLGVDNVATQDGDDWTLTTGTGDNASFKQGAVISDVLGTVSLTGLDDKTLTGEQIENLFDAMFTNTYKGSLYLGDKLTISDKPTEAVAFADVSDVLTRTQFYEDVTITGVDPETGLVEEHPYHLGNVVLSSTKALNLGKGLLDLNKASDAGYYVTDSAGNAGTVNFVADGTLYLDNGGTLTSITTSAQGLGQVEFSTGTHTVSGDIGASGFAVNEVEVGQSGKATVSGSLYATNNVGVEEKGTLTVNGANLTVVDGGINVEDGTLNATNAAVTTGGAVLAQIGAAVNAKSIAATGAITARENSSIKASGALSTEGALNLLNNSSVDAASVKTTGAATVRQSSQVTTNAATVGGALTVDQASTLTVKASGDNKGDLSVTGATRIGSETSGDGSSVTVDNLFTNGANQVIQVLNASLSTKALDLNGGTLFLDPAYFYANQLVQDGDVDAENSVLEGDIVVGSGSGFFVGNDFASESAFESYAKSLIGTTSADGDTITAVAYLDDTLEVTTGSNLIVDGAVTADNYEDYFTAAEGEYTGDANTFQVADGGYVKMTNDALYDAEGNQVAAVQFENATATVVNDGTLDLLDVDFTVGTPLTVFTANGSVDGVTVTDNGTTVAGNPLYSASFGGNGDLELTYSDALAAARLEYTDDSIADPIKTFAQTDGNFWDASSFVSKALNLGTAQQTGKALNSAVRFAVLGGAVQNAQVAQRAYTDAIEERMGFIAKSSSNIGEVKGTDVTVWVTPQYSYADSDGYSAGKSGGYGMDSKLWGIALGADVAFQNGLTVGAAFHGGSGKSDKNGGGFAKTHSKFTYAGVSLYGAYQYQGFKVLGDFTFTNTRNDIDQDNPVGKIKDKFDTNLYSIGLTGKYDFTFEGGVTVTPHLGVRWSHFKVDSFTGKIDTADNFKGKSFNGDQVTFPVGVGVSKDFRTKNGWALKPAADFSVIPVAGDRDVKSKIVSNDIEMSAKSDISDAVLFRGRVGFDAQYKNFGLGIGYTYLGSKNTSSHSFSVTARYTF